MDEAIRIGFGAVLLHEKIKGGQRKGKPGLKRGPGAMGDFLEMTDAALHSVIFVSHCCHFFPLH